MAKHLVFYEKSTVMLIRDSLLVIGNAVLFKWDLQLFMLSRPHHTFCFKRVVLTACTPQRETHTERHRETDRQTETERDRQRHYVNCSHDVGHPATCLTRRKVESQEKKQKQEIWSKPRSQKVFIHHAAVAAECQCCLSYRFFHKGRSIISGSYHKYNFCHDKGFASTNTCLFNTFCPATNKTHLLLWQKKACCDNTFDMTKLCLPWQMHVCHGKILLWQICVLTNVCLSWRKFCCSKHTFLATKDMVFFMTNVCLLRQK